jgi:hypothetical protein
MGRSLRRAVAGLVLLVARAASAGPWSVTAESSAELDTNVQRLETGPGVSDLPIESGVALFGGHVVRRDKLAGGTYTIGVGALVRVVSSSDASTENVALLSADLRWQRPIGERPVAVGFDLSVADALPITDPVGARTFRNLGADALVVLRGKPDRVLTLAAGIRQFEYKPDPELDWFGPTLNARFDTGLWTSESGTRSLSLAVSAAVEARHYSSIALADECPPDAPADPACAVPVEIERRDRFERAGFDLTYVGREVLAIGYQAILIESNSYQQSLLRHRASASVTGELPGRIYATVIATLEIDQYLDGIVINDDLLNQNFSNLDDENRSSLQLRLGRPLSDGWSLEGRAAAWRDIDAPSSAKFSRELFSLGVVYSH